MHTDIVQFVCVTSGELIGVEYLHNQSTSGLLHLGDLDQLIGQLEDNPDFHVVVEEAADQEFDEADLQFDHRIGDQILERG